MLTRLLLVFTIFFLTSCGVSDYFTTVGTTASTSTLSGQDSEGNSGEDDDSVDDGEGDDEEFNEEHDPEKEDGHEEHCSESEDPEDDGDGEFEHCTRKNGKRGVAICHVSASGRKKQKCLPVKAARAHIHRHDGRPGAGDDYRGFCN